MIRLVCYIVLLLMINTVSLMAKQYKELYHDYEILFCAGRAIYKISKKDAISEIYTYSNNRVLSINGISLSSSLLIAFIEYEFDNNNIYSKFYTIDIKGNNLRFLIKQPFLCSKPAWSPDQQMIAFVGSNKRGKDSLYILDVVTKKEKLLAKNIVKPASNLILSWHPDGDKIIFDSINCSILYVNVNNGNINEIMKGDFSSLSKDGKTIIYRNCSNNIFYFSNVEDLKKKYTFFNKKTQILGTVRSSMSWFTNNNLVCFHSYKESFFGKPQSKIYIYNLSSKKIEKTIDILTTSPTGACIIY